MPNLITKNHKSFNKDEEITKINKLTMMLNLKKELLLTNINHLNQIQLKNKNIIKNVKIRIKNKNKNKTPKQQQRAEKANSKIEKRTFND